MLVTGASGFVGSTLIPRLAAEGHELVATSRDPERIVVPGARAMRADVLTGEGLEQALAGVEVAYYLVHSMERLPPRTGEATRGGGGGGGGRDPDAETATLSFSERERIGATRFAEAAAEAGVERIVYLGGPLPKGHPASRHLSSRAEVERILREAIPDTVGLRASIVIGARSRSFRLLVRLVERMPVLALPAWRSHRTNPIDVRDLIEMLIAAAARPKVAGLCLDIGGPDTLTYEEMLGRLAEIMLLPRPALRLRVNLTPIAARVAAVIAEEDPELVLPLMESLAGDLLPADDRAPQLLGVHLHSFDSAVEHALAEWERVEPLAAR